MRRISYGFISILLIIIVFISNASAETVIKQEMTIIFPNVTRTGVYSGEVNENGKPDGFGVFEAVNGEGNRYIIVGEWVDGQQTGEAWCLWENGDFTIGLYDDGHFVAGKYARDVNYIEYDERPKVTIAEGKLIPYEDLIRYKELFDPTMKGADHGKVPVKIEVVVSNVVETDDGYGIDMWIKGDKGYYFHYQKVTTKYLSELYAFPEKPEAGQRIIYEITPSDDGSFRGSDIKSFQVVETNTDYSEIQPANLLTISESGEQKPEESYVLEFVIGNNDKFTSGYSEVWIKDNDGYSKFSEKLDSSFAPGQRYYVGVESWSMMYESRYRLYDDGTAYHYMLVEEGIDVRPFEEAYLESEKEILAADPIQKHLLEPFDVNVYIEIPYKKILRNIEEQAGLPIRIEGRFKQDLKGVFSQYALVADKDGNYYHLEMMKDPINVVDFTLLENDDIVVYGYIQEKLYEYTSRLGDKTVPSIFVVKIDLLEDD